MVSYNNILIPTDGSEESEVTINHGKELANKFDAEIHVIHIVDVRVNNTHDIYEHVVEELEEIGEKAVEDVIGKFEDEKIKTFSKVKEGIPHREIIQYSNENEIDLILMGTHGRTGLDRLLLGSTAEKVLRTSEVPVMTVRRKNED